MSDMPTIDSITTQWMEHVVDTITQAQTNNQQIRICSGRSKAGTGESEESTLQELNLSECNGVVCYDPSELFITARAGTQLDGVVNLLAEQHQQFAFEPPQLPGATLGGVVATGVTGSAMPYNGALRNALLAVRMVNGLGHPLSFGVPVIKNVAGFDVARLMSGSFGTLGPLLEVTLRVVAMPETEVTLCFEATAQQAVERMVAVNRNPWPISAQSWHNGVHCVRLSGSNSGVAAAERKLGGERQKNATTYWSKLSCQHLDDFYSEKVILRHSCRADLTVTDTLELQPFLIDWAGGLRWYAIAGDQYLALLQSNKFTHMQEVGGYVWRSISPCMQLNNVVALSGVHKKLHEEIKKAFDPHGLCNPDYVWHM